MGKASISIAITSNFSSKGIDAAIRKMEQLNAQAISLHGQFGKSAIDAGAQLGQLGARLDSIGQSIASFGDKLTMGITLPVGIAATASTIAAAQIDTAWYNVRKTVDMTEEGYERLKEGAIALSDTQPVSAETLLNIESLGGQLGITTGYLEEFARVVSGLDIATNMDFQTSASSLAQFRNIVSMSEDDLDNWASTVVDLGNHTATTEADLVNLAMRFASAGHIAGMSNADILGMSAALAGLGMRAEAGGSAISRTINDINTSVSVGGDKIKKWADLVKKTPEEFAAAWRSDPTKEFLEVLQNIGNAGSDMGKVLDDLGITQIRQSDAMRRLASSGEYVNDVIERANVAWKENSALTTEVERRNESIAAKFQTIWNRLTNTAAEIGEPVADILISVLDGLQPFLDMLRDMAQAFTELDPVTQRFAVNLTGITVAAGPLLSIFGRLVSSGGKWLQWVGRMTQQWGRFKEALHTSDAAMLNTLTTQDTWAVKLGLSHNKIVQAVGGLERYRSAVVPYVRDVLKQAEAAEKAAIAEEAQIKVEAMGLTSKRQVNKEINAIIHSEESRNRVAQAGVKAVSDLSEEELVNAAASKKAGDAAKSASVGFASFKSVLVGLAGMAAIGAAIAGFTYLASAAQVAKEREEALEKATRKLNLSFDTSTKSAGKVEKSNEELSKSYANTVESVREAIDAQGEFIDSVEETISSGQDEMVALDLAWQTIEKYANQSGLSADKQLLLKDAVDKVNQACGTQYSVVDASRGIIQDETGEILNNTDAIKKNVEQRKKEIELRAYESAYEEAVKNRISAEAAEKDAKEKSSEAVQRYNALIKKEQELKEQGKELTGDERAELDKLIVDLGELGKATIDASETADKAREYERQLADELGIVGERLNSVGTYFSDFAADDDMFDAFGDKVDEVAHKFHSLGINIEAVRGISSGAAQKIKDSYDGTSLSIVKAMKEIESTKYIVENIGNNWYETFDKSTQAIISSITSMGEYTNAELMALTQDLQINTEQSMQGFLAGLEAGLDPSVAAVWARKFDGAFSDALTPDQARAAAQAYMQAIADGLSKDKALEAAEQVIQSLQQTLNGASFDGSQAGVKFADTFTTGTQSALSDKQLIWSDTGKVVGYALADGTRIGIEEGGDGVPTAIQNMVDGGQEPLYSLIPLAYSNGLQVGPSYSQGISDGSGNVSPVVSDLWGGVVSDLQQGIPGAESAGNDTGAGYSNKIASQQDPAVRAAKDTQIGVIEAYILGIVAAKIAGETIGTRFAGGITSKMFLARDAAQAVANMAARSFNSGSQYAYNSGLNLGNNFAAGISASSSRIAAAASNAAAAASRFLHHSTPEAGPLKDDDVWGYHFTQNIANGMRKGTSLIARQANAIAQTMAATDYKNISSSVSRAVANRYGTYGTSWQGYSTRSEIAAQTPATSATPAPLTREDIRSAMVEAFSEIAPPEVAMYVSGSKLASTIANDMDYALGQLDARR